MEERRRRACDTAVAFVRGKAAYVGDAMASGVEYAYDERHTLRQAIRVVS